MINNINIGVKVILKIAVFLMGFGLFLGNVSAAVIESTTDGGSWNSSGTWVGGVVPGDGDDVVINGTVIITGNTTLNGNLTINNGSLLKKRNSIVVHYLKLNGNFYNNGTFGGENSYASRLDLYINGDLYNNGNISYINNIYLYGNLDNINGIIESNLYLKWNSNDFLWREILDSYNYVLNISGIGSIDIINSTQYLLPNSIKNGSNLYWKVKGKGLIFDSDWTETKCINVVGCVNISLPLEPQVPTPTNLKQYIKSPLLIKEEILPGSKIGKFQSGSGVILSADFINEENKEIKLLVKIYEHGKINPKEIVISESTTESNGTLEVIVPYLGAGDYNWKAKIIDNNGNESEAVDYGTNLAWEIDFSLFEGFEPYPYGFSFYNRSPDKSLLTGGISNSYLVNPLFTVINKTIEDGTKWEIFEKAFDTSGFKSDREKISAFEILGLNNENIFQRGNCYGMAVSSAMQYSHPDFMSNHFSGFKNTIGTGTIWHNIESPSSCITCKWDDYNDTLETILAFQLSQKSVVARNAALNGVTDLDLILNTIKNNIDKTYTLSLKGKDENGGPFGHRVVPYKVEGNKIYFWDNNFEYPYRDYGVIFPKYANDQYIEIYTDTDGKRKWKTSHDYKVDEYGELTLVDMNKLYNNGNKSTPTGFGDIDYLYALSGSSDLYVIDSLGRTSGFIGGDIIEEIPGVNVIIPENFIIDGDIIENTWKQIYLAEKIEGLTLNISGKEEEFYDLMIAGGDYYTKLEGIKTSSGEIDTFEILRESIKIDFDDNKTGTYNILVEDFQNSGTGTVYLHEAFIIPEKQKFTIDWYKVIQNDDESVKYLIDTNNDGNFDLESYLSAMPKAENKTGSISGYVISQPSNAGYKVCIDKNNNGKCEENTESFVVTDNTGYYKFDNLEKGYYTIIQVPKNNWEIIKPFNKIYQLKLNNGQNIVNLNFENKRVNGNNKK